MTASCPAPDCDYVGAMEAVCGHIGGSSDPVHSGIDATEMMDRSRPAFLKIAVAGVILYAVHSGSSADETLDSGSSGLDWMNLNRTATKERPPEGAYEGVQPD